MSEGAGRRRLAVNTLSKEDVVGRSEKRRSDSEGRCIDGGGDGDAVVGTSTDALCYDRRRESLPLTLTQTGPSSGSVQTRYERARQIADPAAGTS